MSSNDPLMDADIDAHQMIAVLTTQLRDLETALEKSQVIAQDSAPAPLPDMPDAAFWARSEVLNQLSRALIAPDKAALNPDALQDSLERLPGDDRVAKLYADVMAGT